jgi:hypothetical protein
MARKKPLFFRLLIAGPHSDELECVNPKNAFIGVGLFFENRQEARKLGLLPPGKSFEAICERLEPQERKERVFKGQPDIDDFNYIFWFNE